MSLFLDSGKTHKYDPWFYFAADGELGNFNNGDKKAQIPSKHHLLHSQRAQPNHWKKQWLDWLARNEADRVINPRWWPLLWVRSCLPLHQPIILVCSQSHPPAWNQGSQPDPAQEATSAQKTICSVYSLNIAKLGKTSVLANTNRPGSTACFGAICLYIYLCFLCFCCFCFFLIAVKSFPYRSMN